VAEVEDDLQPDEIGCLAVVPGEDVVERPEPLLFAIMTVRRRRRFTSLAGMPAAWAWRLMSGASMDTSLVGDLVV
jgi:hypothetical protein